MPGNPGPSDRHQRRQLATVAGPFASASSITSRLSSASARKNGSIHARVMYQCCYVTVKVHNVRRFRSLHPCQTGADEGRSNRAELRSAREVLPGHVGFVPTMGALHEGHAFASPGGARQQRVGRCEHLRQPDSVRPERGLRPYPRDEAADLAMLERHGVDVGVPAERRGDVSGRWHNVRRCRPAWRSARGRDAPGHFRGVATVVTKLFSMVQPHRAYFGQKDGQQSVVIRRLTRDLGLPLEIVVCPTVREPDGLALSSRNRYLTPEERAQAPALYRALQAARPPTDEGERSADKMRSADARRPRRRRRSASPTTSRSPTPRLARRAGRPSIAPLWPASLSGFLPPA